MASIRNSLLAKVHIARKDLNMAGADYRGMLETLFNTDSAGKLSIKQLENLVQHFGKLGWQEKPRRGKPRAGTQTRELISKVEALLAEMHRLQGNPVPWEYAVSILKRQGGPEKLEWATSKQLCAVIAALSRRVDTLEQDRLIQQAAL